MAVITKIEIVSTMELDIENGEVMEIGAPFKISVEFPYTFEGFRFDISPFKSMESFENNEPPVEIQDIAHSGEHFVGSTLMSKVNMMGVYQIIKMFINNQFEEEVCDLIIETEE
jgi:hypothetical protein